MAKLTLFYAAFLIPISIAAPSPVNLYKRQDSSTANDLVDGSACKALTLIFARGTSESGNMGSVVGPPFASALDTDLGTAQVAVQGVDYSASVDGAIEGGDPDGSTNMTNLVAQAVTQCPTTKIVMSGYSQGAQLVHNAAKKLTSAQSANVAAVVVFGDPDDGQAVGTIPAAHVKTYCASGDEVCSGTFVITPAHLSYGSNASDAANFVVTTTGLTKAA